jgi:hypothetical protein
MQALNVGVACMHRCQQPPAPPNSIHTAAAAPHPIPPPMDHRHPPCASLKMFFLRSIIFRQPWSVKVPMSPAEQRGGEEGVSG